MILATLAIGTEITDGQISDRNSQWLSRKAIEFGYEVKEHRAVPDDRAVILSSLQSLAETAQVVLVTGGLGPTSDDFTRECIAEFVGEELIWDEASWSAILDRLKSRGARSTENQKQQCYYPRGAVILKNTHGTANGFTVLTRTGVRVVSLPGPPREVEAIWNESLADLLSLPSTNVRSELTLLRTMGLGEGALAFRVEEILDEALCKFPGVERPVVGYRAHVPYVEVKLWAQPSQIKLVEDVAQSLRTEFASILVNEGDEDVADAVLSILVQRSVAGMKTRIIDGVTHGEILARLHARAHELRDPKWVAALGRVSMLVVSDDESTGEGLFQGMLWKLGVGKKLESGSGSDLDLEISAGAMARTVSLPLLATSLFSERGRKWAIEIALRELGKMG